jgi:CheY-like chemotaxis protein
MASMADAQYRASQAAILDQEIANIDVITGGEMHRRTHALRAYTTESLRELGYRVLEAASGAAALELLGNDIAVDLLFTDVMMPGGINGRQLADDTTRIRPMLKVLFTTGYTRNAIVHHGRLDPGIHLIGKPFSFQELATRVRARLDAPD